MKLLFTLPIVTAVVLLLPTQGISYSAPQARVRPLDVLVPRDGSIAVRLEADIRIPDGRGEELSFPVHLSPRAVGGANATVQRVVAVAL